MRQLAHNECEIITSSRAQLDLRDQAGMSRSMLKITLLALPSLTITRPLMSHQGRSGWRDDVAVRPEGGQLVTAFNRLNLLAASIIPAAVHHRAMLASRQRLTLWPSRRTVPFIFSIMLAQARERKWAGPGG